MLTNREIATLILLAVFLVLIFVGPKIRKQAVTTLKLFFGHQIVLINLIYLAYCAAAIYIANRIGAWDIDLVKDTIVVLLVVGYPMVFRANKIDDGVVLVRRTLKETFGLSAFVVFYVNLSSLPIGWELVLQITAIFAAALAAVAKYQGVKARSVVNLMNGVLILIGLVYLVTTSVNLASGWRTEDWTLILRTLGLTLWLPIALLPLIYIGALLMRIQVLIVMVRPSGAERVPFGVKLALVLGLHGSVRLAADFIGKWRWELGESKSFNDANRLMKRFRRETKAARKRTT